MSSSAAGKAISQDHAQAEAQTCGQSGAAPSARRVATPDINAVISPVSTSAVIGRCQLAGKTCCIGPRRTTICASPL